jgi:hypothetical protein
MEPRLLPSHSYTKKESDAAVHVLINVNTFCQCIFVGMLNFSPMGIDVRKIRWLQCFENICKKQVINFTEKCIKLFKNKITLKILISVA